MKTETKTWLFAAAIVVAGIVRAATCDAPIPPRGMQPNEEPDAFEWIASHEREMREHAMASFPSDAWSRDDDFAASERGKMIEYSDRHQVKREDVLRAFDDQLRAGRKPADGQPIRATVTPCKPRAMD